MRPIAYLACLTAIAPQPAYAEDYVFKGDCARARLIQSERTIDTLLPYDTYQGVQRMNVATDPCGRDVAHFYTLTRTNRGTTRMVYDVRRVQISLFNSPGSCADPERSNATVTGSVTLDLRLQDLGGNLCEIYIWTDWAMRIAGNTEWQGNFATRMIPVSNGSFVLAQLAPVSGKFYTPLAFSGVAR